MLIGLILNDDNTIARVIPGVLKIDENSISTVTSRLGGVNFETLNMIVVESERVFSPGERLPSDLVDLSETIKVKPVDDIVNSLGQEIIKLKFEMMNLKGGG